MTKKAIKSVLTIIMTISILLSSIILFYNNANAYNTISNWWDEPSVINSNNYKDLTISGDFDGDGKKDIAFFNYYGNNKTALKVLLSTGGSFSKEDCWWHSEGYNINCVAERVVCGDFNGDGKDDIAAFYDYGNNKTMIHIWLSTGTSFNYRYGWWYSEGYNSNCINNRIVCGDFDGDGKDDIAAFYDYGNNKTMIHVWRSTGESLSYRYGWWYSGGYNSNCITNRVVCGDFNGDGKDDIATLYDYGNSRTMIHIWLSTGGSMNYRYGWWQSYGYNINSISNRVVCGDFNGDGKDDIATLYNYGNSKTMIHIWLSTGGSMNYRYGWWQSTGYDLTKVKNNIICGDFDNDGYDDISSLYSYDNNKIMLHVWRSTGGSMNYRYGWWYRDNKPLKLNSGIDVSHNNGVVNWNEVKPNIDFAIIRCGYGGDYDDQDDRQFLNNIKECERLGIPYGLYFYSYAYNTIMVDSEIVHIERLLKKVGKNFKCGLWIDMEDAIGKDGTYYKYEKDPDRKSLNLTRSQYYYHPTISQKYSDITYMLCKHFFIDQNYYGGKYASRDWLVNVLTDPKLDQFNTWIARYDIKNNNINNLDYKKPFEIWQYTDKGSMAGINNSVDLNYGYFKNRK